MSLLIWDSLGFHKTIIGFCKYFLSPGRILKSNKKKVIKLQLNPIHLQTYESTDLFEMIKAIHRVLKIPYKSQSIYKI